jgi:hypothetical protein
MSIDYRGINGFISGKRERKWERKRERDYSNLRKSMTAGVLGSTDQVAKYRNFRGRSPPDQVLCL